MRRCIYPGQCGWPAALVYNTNANKKNHYAETLNDTVISGLENSYWRFLPPANNFLALFES